MTSKAAALAISIADAVSAAPGVRRLTGGDAIEAATQYPGGKVVGVRLAETVQIHLVADRVPLPPVGAEAAKAARSVLAKAGDDRPVEVFIDDIEEI
ncbi:MAG TPA: hypothetical protein VFC19_22105 [Candidatus Limnocylindrales bacterium]|nr:hypothetical protein [Candidatus Limnocylindrales bacterium]